MCSVMILWVLYPKADIHISNNGYVPV